MKVFVLDCGKNVSTIYDSEKDESKQITHAEVLALAQTLPSDSLVICENAHLGVPRTEKSRSQPFTAEQLLELYNGFAEKNITLKLFPQKSTPNACSYSGLEKSDLNDPKSIYTYWQSHPNISMKNPPSSFYEDKKRLASYKYKSKTDDLINAERRSDVAYSEDGCSQWIRSNIYEIANRLSEPAKIIFKLTEKSKYKTNCKTGKKDEYNFNKVKMNALYAVACTLLDDEGNIRIRPETENMPGWGYVKRYVLKFTPFHQKGGVARSNLWWHTFRFYLIDQGKLSGLDFRRKVKVPGEEEARTIRRGHFTPEEEQCFLKERKVFADAVRELWQVCRDMIKEDPALEYQDSGVHSEQSEFTNSSRTPELELALS